jgi:ribonuclease-3
MKKLSDNERLEFLGDAVLEVVSSEFLYKEHTDLPEGDLTKLRASIVCEPTLALCTREIDLGKYLYLGKGENLTGGRGRKSILSDALEAVIGAIYLDGGFEQAQTVILRLYAKILADLPERMGKDPKTKLQEVLQGNHLPLPAYRVVSCTGQANSQTFVCECAVEHFGIRTEGTGTNRRDAEQHAAAAALKALQEKPEAAKLKPASA